MTKNILQGFFAVLQEMGTGQRYVRFIGIEIRLDGPETGESGRVEIK